MNLFVRRKFIVLEIHPVFLRPQKLPANKNLLFKTAKHSKARDFSARQDKKSRQGWRLPWLFSAVLQEKILVGAYKSLCEAALWQRPVLFKSLPLLREVDSPKAKTEGEKNDLSPSLFASQKSSPLVRGGLCLSVIHSAPDLNPQSGRRHSPSPRSCAAGCP